MEEGQLPGRPFTALTVSKPVYSSGFTDLARQPYASVTPGQNSVVEASPPYLIRLNLDKFQDAGWIRSDPTCRCRIAGKSNRQRTHYGISTVAMVLEVLGARRSKAFVIGEVASPRTALVSHFENGSYSWDVKAAFAAPSPSCSTTARRQLWRLRVLRR